MLWTFKIKIYFNRYQEDYINCKIITTPVILDYMPVAWGFQKYSPYLSLFNYHLKRLQENGSIQKHYKKFELPPQVCPDSAGKAIGFNVCVTAFLAFVGR